MFELMETYYSGVERRRFDADLNEKDWAVLLTSPTGSVAGFTTLKLIEVEVGGVSVRAIYSGDTIVDRSRRSTLSIERGWIPFVFSLVLARPQSRWFWFTVCKGYRTYRYFPTHFYRFIPGAEGEVDPFWWAVLETLAREKFGEAYDPGSGVVTPRADYLIRPGVADITRRELENLHIAYFVSRNPGWQKGEELACLTELRPDNLRPLIRRLLPPVERPSL